MEEEVMNNGEEVMGSSLTMEKVAAAKQFIENHYKNQMKSIQERKESHSPLSPIKTITNMPITSFHFHAIEIEISNNPNPLLYLRLCRLYIYYINSDNIVVAIK
ncbi:Uncharacterized protein Fot_05248 [Forsythia ovata]|uniref:Uncharacterized protein n=1 Tax=Forsythia ovata TaxID=205694 RepID=A0ABD1WPM9_9LAMI